LLKWQERAYPQPLAILLQANEVNIDAPKDALSASFLRINK
jgi:hypothetical protein